MDEQQKNQPVSPSPSVETKNAIRTSTPPKKLKLLGILVSVAVLLLVGAGLVFWLPSNQDVPSQTTAAGETSATSHPEETTSPADSREESLTDHTHVVSLLDGVQPTCTRTGLTEGEQCTECGEILIAQDTIPATGHNFGEWITDQEAEPGVEGQEHRTCTSCGRIERNTITALSYSIGLSYDYHNSGWFVNGIGSCTDKNIVIPAMYNSVPVKGIDFEAFLNCTDLQSISIPDSVTSIGNSAFAGCSGLTSITIPDSVTSIDSFAFQGCSGLSTIEISDQVTSIGNAAFADCSGLMAITVDKNNPNYRTVDGILYNRDVTSLLCCPAGKTEITIPQSVTRIFSYSFYGCSKLSDVPFPDGIVSIGNSSFWGCSGLMALSLPDGLRTIGDKSFQACSGLTSVVIPHRVVTIGPLAFADCSALTSVSIPDSVTRLDNHAFLSCPELTLIQVDPNNPNYCSIDGSLYSKDATILIRCAPGKTGNFVVPDTTTTIESSAFLGCAKLASITIPTGITHLQGNMFFECTNLSAFIVDPENPFYCSIEGVLYSEIAGKPQTCLKYPAARTASNYQIPDGVTSIDVLAFGGCTGLTQVHIPDSLVHIGGLAFEGCSALTSIVIPNGVTTLDWRAFSNCHSLTSIVIPQSVKNIGERIFFLCSNLTDIYYSGTESEWNAIEKHDAWDFDAGNYTIHYNYVPD